MAGLKRRDKTIQGATNEASKADSVRPLLNSLQIAEQIESRQDEVLRQLDELNARLEQALRDLGVEVAQTLGGTLHTVDSGAVESRTAGPDLRKAA